MVPRLNTGSYQESVIKHCLAHITAVVVQLWRRLVALIGTSGHLAGTTAGDQLLSLTNTRPAGHCCCE